MESEVLTALYARACEIERVIDGCQRKIALLEGDLSSVRAVLTLHAQKVAADFLPHMSVRRLFRRSEIFEYCRRALLKAGGPLDTRELTEAVIVAKGLDATDRALRKKLVFSVSSALMTARRYRRVEACGRRKGVRLWLLRASSPMDDRRPRLRPQLRIDTDEDR